MYPLFNSVKVTELPPVWERAANSAYHLLLRCLLRYVCPSPSLMFRTSDLGSDSASSWSIFTSLIYLFYLIFSLINAELVW